MRRRTIALTVAAGTAATLALVACVDLFHSTSDILNACELDAATDGCATTTDAEADVTDAELDVFDGNLCSLNAAQARATAETACAWLGACETPLGQNRYATCVEHAILAYDCTANASLPVRGPTLTFWQCMATATDCTSIHKCAWGLVQPVCPAQDSGVANTVCNQDPMSGASLIERGQCPLDGSKPQPHAENCAAWGQTCSFSTSSQTQTAICAGDTNGNGNCAGPGCNGTMLVSCDDAGNNVGIDCNDYGQGECVTAGSAPACRSVSMVGCFDAGSPDYVACQGHNALGCPDGVHEETIDCNALTEGAGTCTVTTAPGWDVSRACFASGATCNFDDTCNDGLISSCDRGVIYRHQCSAPFTGCRLVSTADGDFMRAECIAP